MSTTHELKTWPKDFEAIRTGQKPFDIRKNDRGFAVGDRLLLLEWEPDHDGAPPFGRYTGRVLGVEVTYLVPGGKWGLPDDLCVMGIAVRAAEPKVRLAELDAEILRLQEERKALIAANPELRMDLATAVRLCAEAGALADKGCSPYKGEEDDDAAFEILKAEDCGVYNPEFREGVLAKAREIVASGQCPELAKQPALAANGAA